LDRDRRNTKNSLPINTNGINYSSVSTGRGV